MLQRITTTETITGGVFKLNQDWFSVSESIIGSIHSTPFPMVIYKPSRARVDYNGLYRFYQHGTDEIRISIFGDHPHITFAHETGHRVEMRGLPELQELFHPQTPNTFMAGWFRAVMNSRCVKDMVKLYGQGDAQMDVLIDYLIDPSEVWARSYAQYVAVKSQHPEMSAELKAIQREYLYNYTDPHPQWDSNDFHAILVEIDIIINRKGW